MSNNPYLILCGHVFPTKKSLRDFVSAILNRYDLKQRVGVDNERFLRALFERHPNRDEKLRGSEISHFEVHPFKHGSRCFFLVRADGSREDFSFEKCI